MESGAKRSADDMGPEDEGDASGNWRKRRWMQNERDSANGRRAKKQDRVLSAKKRRSKGKRVRRIEADHLGLRELCEAAEKFCRECRQAADGNYSTFPKLSYYVDAVMRTSMEAKETEDEEMVFVKTSDGLTKVVFSSNVESALDGVPAALVRKAAMVDERTHLMSSAKVPVAVPVTEVPTAQGEVPKEKEPILTSRVIYPGRPPSTSRMMRPAATDVSGASRRAMSLVESRVIGKNGLVFDRSFPICPVSNGWLWHGVCQNSGQSSAALSNLFRPIPLVRFGSGSSGQVAPTDVPFAVPASIPPFTENKHGPAVMFKASKNGHQTQNGGPFHRFSGSIPFLDPSVLSKGSYFNGKNQVYPSLRPPRMDGSMHVTGGYFVPSISESLKEAVKPNVPLVTDTVGPTVNQRLGLSDESKFALMNILDWVKSGASLQSCSRDARHLNSQHGQI